MSKFKTNGSKAADAVLVGFVQALIPPTPFEKAIQGCMDSNSALDAKKKKLAMAKDILASDPNVTTLEDAIKLVDQL